MSQKRAKQRRREQRELRSTLAEQLRLLSKRCKDYDEGDWEEAIELAARLRVILHPGGKSTNPSVLQSLGAEKVPLLSTCEPIPENALMAHSFYRQRFFEDENGVHYELSPKLEEAHYKAYMAAPKWWEQIVGIVGPEPDRSLLRRKNVITDVANQGGGAHVANLVSESYDIMSKPGGIITVTFGSELGEQDVPISGVHFVMLRKMAYEVLHSPALQKLAD
jgi:hypothetical protein